MKKRLSFLLALTMVCTAAIPAVAGATTIDDLEKSASSEEGTEAA